MFARAHLTGIVIRRCLDCDPLGGYASRFGSDRSGADSRSLVGGSVSGLATVLVVLAIPVSSAKATLATVPVPYMGWNTYYGVGGTFNRGGRSSRSPESLISSGLAQAGYKIVWLDFGWATGARDSNGNLIVNSTQWPDGMSGLTPGFTRKGCMRGSTPTPAPAAAADRASGPTATTSRTSTSSRPGGLTPSSWTSAALDKSG